MDRVRTAGFRGADNRVDREVTLSGRRRPDTNGAIRERDVQRPRIRIRLNRNRLDAQFPAGANDAHRNLAAVGDQNPLKA